MKRYCVLVGDNSVEDRFGAWVPAEVAQALYDELRYAVSWYRSEMEICENDDNEYCASQWRERMNSAAAALSLADGESE